MSTQTVHLTQPATTHYCRPCERRGRNSQAEVLVYGEWWCMKCRNEDWVPRPQGSPARAARYVAVAETLAIAEKFVPFANGMKCVRCGESRPQRQLVCTPCYKHLTVLRAVKSSLRAYKNKANLKCLQNAVALIRRHGIKPEELEKV